MKRDDDERTAISVLVCFTCLSLALMCVAIRACEARAAGQDSPARMAEPAAVSGNPIGFHDRLGAGNADGGTVGLIATLVHVAVGEADFSASDHAAIWHVLQARADRAGVPLETMVKRYSAIYKGTPSARIRWVMELDETCSQPPSWPANAAWSRYRERCHRAFGHARAFLRGELANPCPSARHFGGMRIQADRDRMVRAVRAGRWRIVKCSLTTANTYLAEVMR